MTFLLDPFRLAPSFAPEDVSGAAACWVADDLSAVGDGNAVSSWVDRVGSFDAAQTSTKRPIYRASGVGGQPSVDFDGTDDMLVYAAASAVSTSTSGHVFVVCSLDTLSTGFNSGLNGLWSSSDEATTNVRLLGMCAVGTGAPTVLQVFQQNADTADRVLADDLTVSTSTSYLLEIASSGTAYTMRKNNTSSGSITTASPGSGSNAGDWFGDVSGRDNFVIGGMKRSTETAFLDGKIAMVLVVDGAISAGDRTALHAWVSGKYGITIA